MNLKNSLLILSVLVLLFSNSSPAFAHAGPPFIKVNGKSTLQNATYAGSNLLHVPYENAPENYLIGQPLNFTVEKNLLQVDPSIISQSNFTWNFGDNILAKSLESSHTYSKEGSYFVNLKVIDPTYGQEIELENLQVNILPESSYQLPKAVIKVNGKKISDPLKSPAAVSKDQSLELDAGDSTGTIKSFQWDFGDGSALATGKKVQHTFKFKSPYNYSIFPLLRVTDSKGFTSDSFVQISNSTADNPSTTPTTNSETNSNNKTDMNWTIIAIGFIVFCGLLFLIFKNLPKKEAA